MILRACAVCPRLIPKGTGLPLPPECLGHPDERQEG
jgi:hypothetical protein